MYKSIILLYVVEKMRVIYNSIVLLYIVKEIKTICNGITSFYIMQFKDAIWNCFYLIFRIFILPNYQKKLPLQIEILDWFTIAQTIKLGKIG